MFLEIHIAGFPDGEDTVIIDTAHIISIEIERDEKQKKDGGKLRINLINNID